DVTRLWQRGEDREIGSIASAEIQRTFGAEIGRSLGLERLMLGMVAAQQARAAGSDRNAAGNGIGRRLPQFLGLGETEIVVRGEIDAGARTQASQPVLALKLTKLHFDLFVSHRFARGEQVSCREWFGLACGAIRPAVQTWERF